jgi:hypothetical protein
MLNKNFDGAMKTKTVRVDMRENSHTISLH